MTPGSAWRLRPGRPEDAGEVHVLTLAAFVPVARELGEVRLPPLAERLQDVAADLADPAVRVVVAEATAPSRRPGRLLGAVRVRLDAGPPPTGHLARLAVVPDARGAGLGAALLAAAEEAAAAAGAVRAALFTGATSAGPLRLYARAGYARLADRTDSLGVPLAVLAKDLPAAGA